MRIKRPKEFAEWEFFILDEGNEIRIPTEGYAGSLKGLKSLVIKQFNNMPNFDWKAKLTEEADKNKISKKSILSAIIHHQICNRNESVECWDSGIGDTLHGAVKSVESFVSKVVPKFKPVLSDCAGCGGTKIYDPAVKNNLGRAGIVNSIGRKPKDRIPMG